MKRTETYEEIKPLIDLCKAGKLFEVQEWIASGKPINPPPSVSGYKRKSPLEVAMELGFHSLVQVLLDGGADINEPRYWPLDHALYKRRLDLVKLLVEHGADIHSVSMTSVFETWQPEIMKWFIEQGADVETENPLAYALCHRIRTVLGIFKSYKDRFPSFQEQANIALRHHCKAGNLKWVSLTLWAGADPYAKGPYSWHEDPDPECDQNALELAAGYEHFDIFNLKNIRLDPTKPELRGILLEACRAEKSDFLEKLLKKGFNPGEYENSGTPLIQTLLTRMSWYFDLNRWDIWRSGRTTNRNLDNKEAREKIKMIHLLTKHGAKWVPKDRSEIGEARRSLLKMKPDYMVEFIWIMSKYSACKREDIEELIRTPSIRSLISKHSDSVAKMINTMVSEG
ncbi:ankyrin repeat domain-containing protein [Thermodesulfobacteriota bacterium]